ncbi:hypothetical protein HZ326_4676 [Fusarium oxysporum f. sp. albedinis]|nr:hypothetical protein HZ326_4676 [Fusarium oxysporum f. sp. albedinis]
MGKSWPMGSGRAHSHWVFQSRLAPLLSHHISLLALFIHPAQFIAQLPRRAGSMLRLSHWEGRPLHRSKFSVQNMAVHPFKLRRPLPTQRLSHLTSDASRVNLRQEKQVRV